MTSFDSENPVFTPSEVLVGMVRQALVDHAVETGWLPAEATAEVMFKERAAAITRPRILEAIAAYARRMAAGVVRDRALIAFERFNDEFANEVFESMPLSYTVSKQFFEQLRHELVVFLAHGGEIAGSWGRLALSGGSVSFELTTMH